MDKKAKAEAKRAKRNQRKTNQSTAESEAGNGHTALDDETAGVEQSTQGNDDPPAV